MVFVLLVYTKKKGTFAKLYSRNTASTEWERSPYTHTIRAQNRFKLTQNNFYLYHSAVRSGVVTDTIIRAWCVIVNSVRPHEEVLNNEVLSLDIRALLYPAQRSFPVTDTPSFAVQATEK